MALTSAPGFNFLFRSDTVRAMRQTMLRYAGMAVTVFVAVGCTSVSSNYAGDRKAAGLSRIEVCHGFNCYFQSRYAVTPADHDQFARIMAYAPESPEAERAAIANAIMFFEDRATDTVGIADEAKSGFRQSGKKGQMDCIDESTNSRSLMLFLERNGWLKHHAVLPNVSRGAFLDARYPHSTAVVREHGSGRKWAIDSWYEPAGGAPDVRPLEEWRQRGVWGER